MARYGQPIQRHSLLAPKADQRIGLGPSLRWDDELFSLGRRTFFAATTNFLRCDDELFWRLVDCVWPRATSADRLSRCDDGMAHIDQDYAYFALTSIQRHRVGLGVQFREEDLWQTSLMSLLNRIQQVIS